MSLFLLVLTTLILSILGSVIYLSDSKKPLHRVFAFISLSAIAWNIFNYASNLNYEENTLLLVNKASLFAGAFLIASVWYLSVVYLQRSNKHTMQQGIVWIMLCLVGFGLFASDQLVADTKRIEGSQVVEIVTGDFFVLYVLFAGVALAFTLANFLKAYRLYAKSKQEKKQTLYVAASIISAFLWAVLTAVLLPLITGDWSLSQLGYASVLFMSCGISYAIFRHKLFDLSTIVLRSFVYTFTTAFLVSIYSAVSLTIKSYLVSANISTNVTTMAEIGLLAIFGISFYPLRLYFDRLTTKIFFRNHYNTHQLIRTINNILAQSVDLAKMLHKITNLLKSSMLVEYTAFLLIEAERTREIGVGKLPVDMEAIIGLQKYFTKKRNVLVVDQLDSEKIDKDLMAYLQAQKVSAVVRLEKLSQDKRVESEGYLIIGKKQSGKSINSQDERLLETISGHLAAAIQNLVHLDEITGFNEKLQHEVADATKELKVKNSKLKQLDHNKDEFVSMASHQLRTPLTSVKGYLSMVLDGDAGELKPAQRQLLEQAYTSTQRMVFLIADLLNLSRLNSGKFVISPEPTSLAAIIEGEIKQVQKTAELKGLKVSFFCDPSIPNLQLDQMKIRQVIMNFIDNAIYYTPEGGAINISLRKDGKTAVFSVIDNGMGVPKTEQKELFNKFYRGSNARKSRPDGTGLGLYMAKKVIDAQGGKIVFQSREDEGSTFGFSFDLNPKA